MDALRVPTTSLLVEIRCAGGDRIHGEIFLPTQSSRQSGPMRPDEWSDTIHPFFPFRSKDDQALTILNRETVVAITVPAAANTDEDEALLDQPVSRLVVDAGGAQFEGDVVIDMPREQSRVADFLNTPAAFITVRDGFCHHLVQKRHVTRVVELRRLRA